MTNSRTQTHKIAVHSFKRCVLHVTYSQPENARSNAPEIWALDSYKIKQFSRLFSNIFIRRMILHSFFVNIFVYQKCSPLQMCMLIVNFSLWAPLLPGWLYHHAPVKKSPYMKLFAGHHHNFDEMLHHAHSLARSRIHLHAVVLYKGRKLCQSMFWQHKIESNI